jgi:hypothetical protein
MHQLWFIYYRTKEVGEDAEEAGGSHRRRIELGGNYGQGREVMSMDEGGQQVRIGDEGYRSETSVRPIGLRVERLTLRRLYI